MSESLLKEWLGRLLCISFEEHPENVATGTQLSKSLELSWYFPDPYVFRLIYGSQAEATNIINNAILENPQWTLMKHEMALFKLFIEPDQESGKVKCTIVGYEIAAIDKARKK